jgi:hypothetical protein
LSVQQPIVSPQDRPCRPLSIDSGYARMHTCCLLASCSQAASPHQHNTHVTCTSARREREGTLVGRKSSRHACKVVLWGVCSDSAPQLTMTACPCTSALSSTKAHPLGIWIVKGDRHANRRPQSKNRDLETSLARAVKNPSENKSDDALIHPCS